MFTVGRWMESAWIFLASWIHLKKFTWFQWALCKCITNIRERQLLLGLGDLHGMGRKSWPLRTYSPQNEKFFSKCKCFANAFAKYAHGLLERSFNLMRTGRTKSLCGQENSKIFFTNYFLQLVPTNNEHFPLQRHTSSFSFPKKLL